MAACGICAREDLEEAEALAVQAVNGEISWRQVARDLGLSHHQAIKNHMERHYTPPEEGSVVVMGAAADTLERMVMDSIAELELEARSAPTTTKPLYALAIRNLTELWKTKPSQANLIAALKGIHEITGMKQQQRVMLDFARAAIGAIQPPAINPAVVPAPGPLTPEAKALVGKNRRLAADDA